MYKRLIKYFYPYRIKFIQALVCMAGVAGLTTASMWLLKTVVDNALIAKNSLLLIRLVIIIPILYLFKGLFVYFQNYLMNYIAQKITRDIRNELFTHLQTLSFDFYDKSSTGRIISRLTNDVKLLETALINIPATLVRDSLTLIFLVGLLFYLHWKFALISLVVFPLSLYPLREFSRKMRKISRLGQEKMSDLYALIQELVFGISVVKSFGQEEKEIEHFRKENDSFFKIIVRFIRVEVLSSPVMEFLGAIAASFILLYGGYDVIMGFWKPGAFFAFLGAVLSTYQPIRNFSNFNPILQQALAASERIFSLLDEKPTVLEPKEAKILPPFKEEILYQNVGFAYNGRDYVLQDINLTVKQGEIVALVGPSGAGKTTLVNLLPRFYIPQKGKIYIDGDETGELNLKSLREQIGIVMQEVILFNNTVRNNIAYAKPEATENEIFQAAKIANVHDFILTLPQGYNTIIGERGIMLSGGERQRIAIARAVLKNPPILILDEATSALDPETEKLVYEALDRLMENRTTLVIAHRLSTIKKANKIIVLDRGVIVASGKHEELLEKCHTYRRLYQLQLWDSV
ncbi:MAG TPA: ABC transporter permease [Elusimicrobia bacterium]|jgi:subfamily B ATP-binding cassette protein MsbA|nr:ABC transporter permease [Elusimicrobiota bacterium]